MAGSRKLSDVADELYALAPEDFIAARDAAARTARDDGDRELAAELKQLRRPSFGAWLVNQLVRSRLDELDDLLQLGTVLRQAQDALDGAELRTMSRQRQLVIRALSGTAGDLAAEVGQRIGDAAQREFESTLDAALADENAADAVRSGRLIRGLASSGLEPVDLTNAVAAPGPAAPPRPRQRDAAPAKQAASKPAAANQAPTKRAAAKRAPSRPAPSNQAPSNQAPSNQAPSNQAPSNQHGNTAKRDAAQQAVRDARTELDRAEKELSQREADLAAARTAVNDARDQLAELDAALTEAGNRQTAAVAARRAADQATKAASRRRDAAQRVLITAQRKARQ